MRLFQNGDRPSKANGPVPVWKRGLHQTHLQGPPIWSAALSRRFLCLCLLQRWRRSAGERGGAKNKSGGKAPQSKSRRTCTRRRRRGRRGRGRARRGRHADRPGSSGATRSGQRRRASTDTSIWRGGRRHSRIGAVVGRISCMVSLRWAWATPLLPPFTRGDQGGVVTRCVLPENPTLGRRFGV